MLYCLLVSSIPFVFQGCVCSWICLLLVFLMCFVLRSTDKDSNPTFLDLFFFWVFLLFSFLFYSYAQSNVECWV